MLCVYVCVWQGFADLGLKSVCPQNVTCEPPSAFLWGIIGEKLAFLLLSVPVCYGVLMFIEYKVSPVGAVDKYSKVSAASLGGAYTDTRRVCCGVPSQLELVVPWLHRSPVCG